MNNIKSFITALIAIAIVLLATANVSHAAAGTETYGYDALGRLISITYPTGKQLLYAYDSAGNRRSVTPATIQFGTFTFVSGSHSNKGWSGDIATATVKNTGTGTITSISVGCTGGPWVNYVSGTQITSLAPGASAGFSCMSVSSGASNLTIVIGGSNSTNSLNLSF